MKPIQFNQAQKKLLLSFLESRMASDSDFEQYLKGNNSISNKYYKPIISAINKLQFDNPLILSKSEKLVIVSCINENKDNYEEAYNKINWEQGAYTYVILTLEERQVLQTLDYLEDALQKCGFYKASMKKFSNSDYSYYMRPFENLDKLKSSVNIFYSEAYGSIYKLLFYTDNYEYFQFDLHHGFSLNEPFVKSNSNYLIEKKQHFSGVTTRDQLRKVFQGYERNQYSLGTTKLIEYILN